MSGKLSSDSSAVPTTVVVYTYKILFRVKCSNYRYILYLYYCIMQSKEKKDLLSFKINLTLLRLLVAGQYGIIKQY